MQIRALQCPGCFAPIDPTGQALIKCRYCGTTIALQAPPAAAPARPVQTVSATKLYLDDAGPNKISVIKVVREATGLGLKEAKDIVESAPCLVAEWDDPLRIALFRKNLIAAGARTR